LEDAEKEPVIYENKEPGALDAQKLLREINQLSAE